MDSRTNFSDFIKKNSEKKAFKRIELNLDIDGWERQER